MRLIKHGGMDVEEESEESEEEDDMDLLEKERRPRPLSRPHGRSHSLLHLSLIHI